MLSPQQDAEWHRLVSGYYGEARGERIVRPCRYGETMRPIPAVQERAGAPNAGQTETDQEAANLDAVRRSWMVRLIGWLKR